MNQNLEDNWNIIILAIATKGGYMVEKLNKMVICIPTMAIDKITNKPETTFSSFIVSSSEYKKILGEVLTLKEEIYLSEEEMRIKKDEMSQRKPEIKKKNKKSSLDSETVATK